MGIKFGSVIVAIIFLFIVKISFEASLDTNANLPKSLVPAPSRAPASISSIDEGYADYMRGPAKTVHH